VNFDPTTLIHDYLDGELTARRQAQLAAWLEEDARHVDEFVAECRLHSQLCDTQGCPAEGAEVAGHGFGLRPSVSPLSRPPSSIPPIVLDLSPADQPVSFSGLFGVGGFAFSYAAAAVIMAVALFLGWAWRGTGAQRQLAQGAPAVRSSLPSDQLPRGTQPVARITSMVGCRWADGESAPLTPIVSLGRRYALLEGFMEIAYDTGATVILEGPATYEVQSANGGYLSLGKLTARVESGESRVESQESRTAGRESRGERTVNPTVSGQELQPGRQAQPTASLALRPSSAVESRESRVERHSQPSTLDSQLFFVRTPTAIVTDLGTEFGVEVDRSGTTKSHVFRGRIELRPTNASDRSGSHGPLDFQAVCLAANESAAVEAVPGGRPKVTYGANRVKTPMFVRQMPRWVRLGICSTGMGVAVGERDPHWQIVARSDDPHFVPQPAVVTVAAPVYLPNDPSQSQWVSLADNLPPLPEARFTFRTTFELGDLPLDSIVLQGRFIADNRLTEIRLNGKAVPVPEHRYHPPFDEFYPFTISGGLVKGTNVLEMVVYNFPATKNPVKTPMALRVELKALQFRGFGAMNSVAGKDGRPKK
jgi:hypothetical protein